VKDEEFAVFLGDFADMLTEFEAAVAKMKQQIAKLVGVAEQAQQKPAQQDVQLEQLKQMFGELASYLSFDMRDGKAVVTPRKFLGSEDFAKVARIVRDQGGQYISAGKESRFEITLK